MGVKSLQGRVVLITGASSGFGEDAALLFAAQGCKLVLGARRSEALQRLALKIQAAGGEVLAVPLDVTRLDQVQAFVQAALAAYGQVDILFNNAGVGRVDWFENHDQASDIQTLIAVNLVGLMQVTREVLPHMLARRSGHIINMASVAGLAATPLITSYAASKFGVRGFTDALRREVTPLGLQVSGIYPGPARTEFGSHVGKNEAYRSLTANMVDVHMTSAYVARRVVQVAIRPRRSLVLPWWFAPLTWLDTLFPIQMDWVYFHIVKRKHTLTKES